MESKSVSTLNPELKPSVEHLVPFSGVQMSEKLEGFAAQDHILSTAEIQALTYSETASLMGVKTNFALAKDELVKEAKKAQMAFLLQEALSTGAATPAIELTQPSKPIEVIPVKPETKVVKTPVENPKQVVRIIPEKVAEKPQVEPEIDRDALASLVKRTIEKESDTEQQVASEKPSAVHASSQTNPEEAQVGMVDTYTIGGKMLVQSVIGKLSAAANGLKQAVRHEKVRKVGYWGSIVAVPYMFISITSNVDSDRLERVDASKIADEAAIVQEISAQKSEATTAVEQVTTTSIEEEIVTDTTLPEVTTTEAPTTTAATTSTTQPETTVPETIVAPRTLTLLETVANGERRLEDIPGTQVGTLSVEGICLDGIEVSVINAADPVRHPEILQGVSWSVFNTDTTLAPIPEGDLEAARERLNPLYRLRADETPQQACDMEGVSEHKPRWEKNTAGSKAAKTYGTPAELVPQADIHPYGVIPGQPGVTYIQGHRTTESAPFLNLDALLPGQTATFSDGYNTYNYVFNGFETVNPNIHIDEILNKGTSEKNTLILSTCDEGDDVRLLAIFTQQ